MSTNINDLLQNASFLNSTFQSWNESRYAETPSTAFFSSAPRFGHTSYFASVFSDNSEEQVDYLTGLLYIGIIVIALFLIWFLVLLILKCCCKSCCGFLSGQPMVVKTRQLANTPCSGRPWNVRFVFITSGLLVIVFSAVFWSVGMRRFNSTARYFYNSIEHVASIIDQTIDITDNVLQVSNETQQVQESLVAMLSGHNLCARTTNAAVEVIQRQIGETANESIALIESQGTGNEMGQSNILALQDTLYDAQGAFMDLREFANDMKKTDELYGAIYGTIFGVLSLLLMTSVFYACRQDAKGLRSSKRNCCLSWLVLPIFILWIIVAILGCTVGPVVAVANADFCMGNASSPDSTILQIMEERGYPLRSTSFYIGAKYYIHQCTQYDENPFLQAQGVFDYLVQLRSLLQELIGLLISLGDSETATEMCGENFPILMENLSNMIGSLLILANSIVELLLLFSCDNIVPIYTDTVYDGLCRASINGLGWVFLSLVLASTFGMIMLTLRSSYFNVIVVETDEDDIMANNQPNYNFKDEDNVPEQAITVEENNMEKQQDEENSNTKGGEGGGINHAVPY